MKSYQTNVVECPKCKAKLDAATLIHETEDKPVDQGVRDGMFTICINCTQLCKYSGEIPNIKLEIATLDEVPEGEERLIVASAIEKAKQYCFEKKGVYSW
jgi:hypothetical protein